MGSAVRVLAFVVLAVPAVTYGYLVWLGRASDRDAARRRG